MEAVNDNGPSLPFAAVNSDLDHSKVEECFQEFYTEVHIAAVLIHVFPPKYCRNIDFEFFVCKLKEN